MKILVACEQSGRVRDAFRARGHDAWSCDLGPAASGNAYHYRCDVREILGNGWDLMIAHPPCTYLTNSGIMWLTYPTDYKRPNLNMPLDLDCEAVPDRHANMHAALDFVRLLMAAPIPRIAIENPVGQISTRIRKPDQMIQPHMFGDDARKTTHLWLKNLPLLVPTKHIPPRLITGRPRWGNEYDWPGKKSGGPIVLGPRKERAAIKSVTFQGIADAIAEQWGNPENLPPIL